MSIEAITAERYRETTTLYGASPDRDAAILHAAMGGMLLVSLEPAIARMATKPPTTDPANIALFEPPRHGRRTRIQKPLSDIGLARYDQPLIVSGLAMELREILREPERLRRCGFISYLPDSREEPSGKLATTSVLAMATKPLDHNLLVYRHKLTLRPDAPQDRRARPEFETVMLIHTEELGSEKISLVYRALTHIITQRQPARATRLRHLPTDLVAYEPSYVRPGQRSPWATQRHKPGPARRRH